MKKLYVDMDGTLAVWQKDVPLETVTARGYFRNIPAVRNVVCTIKQMILANEIDVFILSSVFQDDHSIQEKKEWLKEVLPEISEEKMIFVPYGEKKSDYIEEDNAFLLDDFSKNLHEWKGTGIKIYNGINGTHGTWQGYSIHSNMTPDIMYRQLIGIINNAA